MKTSGNSKDGSCECCGILNLRESNDNITTQFVQPRTLDTLQLIQDFHGLHIYLQIREIAMAIIQGQDQKRRHLLNGLVP
jgi:hypothetical protein